MKNKKHDRVVKDFERQKMKHLDRMASDLLKADERSEKLKSYKMKKDPFDLFDDENTES